MYVRIVDITSQEGRGEMIVVEQAEEPRQVHSIYFPGTLSYASFQISYLQVVACCWGSLRLRARGGR